MTLPVGVPRELKSGERRVGLTPEGVCYLRGKAVVAYIESDAGMQSGFSDEDYASVGARIVESREALWRAARVIKKVKEPVPEEFGLIQPGHIIFSFLHLAASAERALVEALVRSRATAIGYETVEKDGDTPLLKPMSVLAGTLAACYAGIFHKCITVSKSEIKGQTRARELIEKWSVRYPEVPTNLSPGAVMILGGGHAGTEAARVASLMGGSVCISEISAVRREMLKRTYKQDGLNIFVLDPEIRSSYETHLSESDCVIGAVHTVGARAPVVIGYPLLEKISHGKKKIIIDVAIDQGGNIAESRPTDYQSLLYLDSLGNIRFSVYNMPSICANKASVRLEEVTLEYTYALAHGVAQATEKHPELRSGINVAGGAIMNDSVRRAHGLS